MIHEVATRDWAEAGAPTLLAGWKNSVEQGVLNWAARWGDAPVIDLAEHHLYAASAAEEHASWAQLASRYCATGKDLTLLGHRHHMPMVLAQHWAAQLGQLDIRLADPRDIPALSDYLQQAHVAGYQPLSDVWAALQDPRPLGARPGQTLMYRLAARFDPQRLRDASGSPRAAHQLDNSGMDLPVGYRLAESGVPGAAPKFQVLRDYGRDEQFIGMSDSRAEAVGLARLHHRRRQTERGSAASRSGRVVPPAPPR